MRVLVVYGSSRGGTAGLAEMVAEALSQHGVDVDLGNASDVDDLEGYDAVVVGGALYRSRWHQDATWFVERTLDELRARPVWFFSSGPLDTSARSGFLAPVAQVQDLAREAEVRGHMTFGGCLEKPSGGFLSSLVSWGKPGDFRDRTHVEEWVERVVAQLSSPRRTITLPDADHSDDTMTARVLRRLATAGDSGGDYAEDLGLDVLVDNDSGH